MTAQQQALFEQWRHVAAWAVKRLCRGRVLTDDVFHDVHQAALLAVWRSALLWDANHASGASFKTYCCRAALRRALNCLRDAPRRPQPQQLHDGLAAREERRPEELPPRLARAVEALPPRERLVVRCYVLGGETLKHAGALLGGVTRERARQILNRAPGRLRDAVA